MDPVTASLVGAGIGAAGDVLGGIIGGNSAANEARKQRQWAARQYGKRYQVAVKDLQAAGLNPMLAYMGQGAAGAGSVPGGAAAPGMRLEGIGSRAIANVLQAQAVKSQVSLNTASAVKAASEGDRASAEADFIRGSQTAESSARTSHYSAQVAEINARVQNLAFELQRGQALLPHEIEKVQAEIRNINASALPKELLAELAGTAMEVLRALKRPDTPSKTAELMRDTVNLIDDKLKHAGEGLKANSARMLREGMNVLRYGRREPRSGEW